MEYGPRALNPLYYDVLAAFERESGLPALVNTSFNVHEEPIVNKPAECARAAGWADRFHRDNAGNLPADPWLKRSLGQRKSISWKWATDRVGEFLSFLRLWH